MDCALICVTVPGRRYLATVKERLASAMDLEAGQLDAPHIQAGSNTSSNASSCPALQMINSAMRMKRC